MEQELRGLRAAGSCSSLAHAHQYAAPVGLPEIRFHDLRHTATTLLLSRGVHPKLVQELLGHAAITQTMDTYSRVLPGMGDQTANAMESALSRDVGEGSASGR